MRKITTEVLVIGGGATGAGILRDLAMRGFKAVLVERSDLTTGTTGRYHGLLHSGGRYAVKDPQAARECILENRILRRIMPQCIEDTGGFFVLTPWDDPAYADRFVAGCRQAGIPLEELSPAQMLRLEPRLNPHILRCFRVPDGSADSFLATELNVASARQYGAQVLTYHPVLELLQHGSRVLGARCRDLVKNELVEIQADLVVNAAGAWAGQIAALLGITVNIVPGKGVMLALNHRPVNTVINRCKPPADGDILVPAHTVAVIGTTDVKVADPDHFAIEPWEIHLMLQEGEKLVPGFQQMRLLRAWAGVRPLYAETATPGAPAPAAASTENRELTRAFVLLDHATRDGVEGLITITSGKWTTYRLMAEATVDLVCRKLGVQRPCRTHLETLPLPAEAQRHHTPGYHSLGSRLRQVEEQHAYGQLICECELVTRQDILNAIPAARTIDDLRRDTRLGMGPCQGGFCTYRAAGLWQRHADLPVRQINQALLDFLQERWKGLLPILWGQQLRQERLDELIYNSLFNASALPHLTASVFAPQNYQPASDPWNLSPAEDLLEEEERPAAEMPSEASPQGNTPPPAVDVLVIGAGLAGLAAAWQAAAQGQRVRVVAKGWGAQFWHTGCIDVLRTSLQTPLQQALLDFVAAHPTHPYARLGLENLRQALVAFQQLCAESDYPLLAMPDADSPLAQNWLLPSALGVPRPTCLAPATMIAGDLRRSDPILVVGFQGFADFYPHWIAANLRELGFPAQALELPLPELDQRRFLSGRILAEHFEASLAGGGNFLPEFVRRLKGQLRDFRQEHPEFTPRRLGLPAVLGFLAAPRIQQQLEAELGLPVFEIPTLPPSIPGMRLTRILVQAIRRLGGQIAETGFNLAGAQIIGVQPATAPQRLAGVWSEAAARRRLHTARRFILATGGLLGGGLEAHLQPDPPTDRPRWMVSDEVVVAFASWDFLNPKASRPERRWRATLRETACGLPLPPPGPHPAWLQDQFLLPSHPIFRYGVPTDAAYRPLQLTSYAETWNQAAQPVYDNLHVIGAALHDCDPVQEGALEGIALATAYHLIHDILPA